MATLINGYGTTIEVSSDTTETATLEPAMDDIPCIYWDGINGASTPSTKDEGEIKGALRYISKTLDFSEYGTIKVQGGGSTGEAFTLKNFTLKFYSDSDCLVKFKHLFRNWGKLNKVVLKKHFIDCSHIRNVGTAKLWGQVVRSRSDFESLPEELRNAPNNGATDGFTVKFFANGVYQGLYELIVPKDKLFGQDDDIVTHSILNSENATHGECGFNSSSPDIVGNQTWSEELQDGMTTAVQTSFNNLISFITTSTDEEFKAGIGNKIDIASVIDMDIFLRLFLITDNLGRNQIVFSYDSTYWYIGAWDLDCVLGLPASHSDADDFISSNGAYPDAYKAYSEYGTRNNLFDRIETNFKADFKVRYWELRKGVLSVSNVISVYEHLASVIRNYDGLLEEDWAETTANGLGVGIPHRDENNIQQIRKFVVERFAYMDGIIEAM